MPAYRSSSEALIRDAVVARIRERRPSARIIHEINVGTYGPNRIDVLAVDRAEIIAVEVKSEKDKLDRLPAQMGSMRRVAHHAIAALHEKFLVEKKTNKWAAHYERDSEFYRKDLPDGLKLTIGECWVFPERRRSMLGSVEGGHDSNATWQFPSAAIDIALPQDALGLLWRDELYALCGALRVSAGSRSTMMEMTRSLRWLCPGKELTKGICAMLRRRRCVEADPEIEDQVAA